MKRHHKILVGVGVVALALGWLAWSVLLTETEMVEPPAVEQPG